MFPNLKGRKWFLVTILICISLITNDVAHPLVFVWAVEGSSSPKCLFTSFSSFSTSKEVYLFLIGLSMFYT